MLTALSRLFVWFFGQSARQQSGRRLLRLEPLEDRLCPAVALWTNALGNNLASKPDNWTNGGPSATQQAVFDPSDPSGLGSNTNCTWDAEVVCNGVVVLCAA